MYFNISKNILENTKDIIAILNIETLEKKDNLENICKKLKISDKIVDVSDGNKKSLILIKKMEEIKGYVSNISSVSLQKRANKGGKK